MICQKHMPSQRQIGDGYKTLEADFIWLQSISCLPQTMNMESLNDGSGISNTLRLVLTLHIGISLAGMTSILLRLTEQKTKRKLSDRCD